LILLCEDNNIEVLRHALKSITEVYCDIIPSYKIRTDEDNSQVSKEV